MTGRDRVLSCDDITKGYLETGEAGYVTDTLRIALAPDSRDSIPYQSEKIGGDRFFSPIYYELAALRDDSGREVEAVIASQVEVVLTGVFRMSEGFMQLPQWAHTGPTSGCGTWDVALCCRGYTR